LEHVRASGFILALTLSAAGAGVAAPQQSASSEQLASVKGVVTHSVTGAPLRKAFVRLHPASGNAKPATTDEQGRFVFEKLTPGSYKLDAEHVGFLQSALVDSTGASIELRLTAGETADVNVKLTPQAAISGRVLDQDGDPWVHTDLMLYRSAFKHGKRTLQYLRSGDLIDDRGQFRVGDLAPGTYYIRAEPNVDWERYNRAASEPKLQPTWYSSSFDVEGSTPIVLSPGQDSSGLEIRLRQAATYRIRGTVSGLETVPGADGTSQTIRNVVASSGPENIASNYTVGLKRDGSFEIQGVPSGEFEIRFDLYQGQRQMSVGHVKIRVDDRDVDDVSIEIPRMRALRGSLRFAGGETTQIPGSFIILTSLETSRANRYSRTREDGAFDFPSVSPGRYRVFLPGTYGGQYYLKLLRYENQESRNGLISIPDGDGPLELVLSNLGARVTADVKQGTTRVVLVPDAESAEEREFNTRTAVRDQNGTFNIGNVAPGAYRLFAFESVPDGAWVDAEFWKEIRSKGAELRISEGESKSADAPLVLKSDIAGLLSRLGMD